MLWNSSCNLLIVNTKKESNSPGIYEFAVVKGKEFAPIRLVLSAPLENSYDSNDKVQILNVPHYENLEIKRGATMQPTSWNGTTGGVLAFRVRNELRVDGVITAKGKGYRGGEGGIGGFGDGNEISGKGGESLSGKPDTRTTTMISGGGEGGGGGLRISYNGGGGGHKTSGNDGLPTEGQTSGAPGKGGNSYGTSDLKRIYLGSGGGGGSSGFGLVGNGGRGGNGGGIIFVSARSILGFGTIDANGNSGITVSNRGSGGGGAGGSVFLRAWDFQFNGDKVQISGGGEGGTGGSGYYRLDANSRENPGDPDFLSLVDRVREGPIDQLELTLINPSGIESWVTGTTRTLSWETSLSQNISVVIEVLDADEKVIERIDGIPADQKQHDWLIPDDVVGSGLVIRIRDEHNFIEDKSSTPFEIVQRNPDGIWFVNQSATGSSNGTSWTNAFDDLQDALRDAKEGDEIWMAAGTFTPTNTGDRAISFELENGVALYGGFKGEEEFRAERERSLPLVSGTSHFVYETILSGDLAGDDGPDFENNGENSYHVVTATEVDDSVVFDGFTISGGNANESTSNVNNSAGGMLIFDSSMLIENCVFTSNSANVWGGALQISQSSPKIMNCEFTNNFSGTQGGGIFIGDGGSPEIGSCSFRNNTCDGSGGGVANQGCKTPTSPLIENCLFDGNQATEGGALSNKWGSTARIEECIFVNNKASQLKNTPVGGGVLNQSSQPSFVNCIFFNNESEGSGGAVYNAESSRTDCDNKLTTKPEIINCTIVGNKANESGGGVFNESDSEAIFTNCIIGGNTASQDNEIANVDGTPTFVNCNIEMSGGSESWKAALGTDGGGNIDADPLFVDKADADGADDVFATEDDGLRLVAGSPCLDSGVADNAPEGDILGAVRPIGDRVDMGAYEGDVSIEVISPVGGESWVIGTTRIIEWTTPPNVNEVDFSLLCEKEEAIPIKSSLPADDGKYPWEIGGDSTKICRIHIVDVDNELNTGVSPQFEIIDANAQTRIFVNDDATGLNNGQSWPNAFTNLQDALLVANADDEIWVAAGTYTPAEKGGDRSRSFSLKNDVQLLGGFSGIEASKGLRFPSRNPTILSGDLNGDDGNEENTSENSYHVLTADRLINRSAVLDGFIITGGMADGDSSDSHGGGLFNDGGSPTVINCSFTGNSAKSQGGAMFNSDEAAPELSTCLFSHNRAQFGGAIYNQSAKPRIIDCRFYKNAARDGGGLVNDASASILVNCVLDGNSTDSENDGRGGAVFNINSNKPIATNCTLVKNKASSGGGIYNSNSAIEFTNCILWENVLTDDEGTKSQIFDDASSTSEVTYCVVQDGYPGIGNKSENPLFFNLTDVDGADDQFRTNDDGLQLLAGSSGIDTGTGRASEFSERDILGNHRFDDSDVLNTGNGNPNFVDVGAYERQFDSETNGQGTRKVSIVIEKPKEMERIKYGQVLPLRATVQDALSKIPIEDGNIVNVDFIHTDSETMIPLGQQIIRNGIVELLEEFAPGIAGDWEVRLNWGGNVRFAALEKVQKFIVDKSDSFIDVVQVGGHLLQTPLTIVGQLRIKSLNPGNVKLSDIEIQFDLKDPDGNSHPLKPEKTTNNPGEFNGRFEVTIPANVFDTGGNWTFQASTPGNSNLVGSPSEIISFRVQGKPGYAILCQGSFPPAIEEDQPEGVDDHKRTIDYVKDVLIADGRGMFDDENSPNSLSDDIYEIRVGDDKTMLEKAIKNWALPKMNEAPAPLYIVLINHGKVNEFHMNGDIIDPDSNDNQDPNVLTPDELQGWLKNLEDGLDVPENIIVVLGMCFSGSFIDELSKPGRIIISASDYNERSIRGPDEESEGRHGEYFVYLLFRELDRGASLLSSFVTGRDIIRQVSSQFDLTRPKLVSNFPGELGQHPLLDDNGNGEGSFNISVESGDGLVAKSIFLIRSSGTSVGNGTHSLLEIARSNPSRFLEGKEDPQNLLWAEVDVRPVTGLVGTIFMEVKKAGALDVDGSVPGTRESMQASLDFERESMNPIDSIRDRVRFEWPGLKPTLDLFDDSGMYQIFYYTKDKADSQPSKPKVSFLFRGSGDFIPTPFKLLTPKDGAIIDYSPEGDDIENNLGLFRWEESHSPAGGVQYILRLWRDQSRSDLIFESDLLSTNFLPIPRSVFPNNVPVWWDVAAVDQKGNARVSDRFFEVTTLFTNPELQATIIGDIRDKATGELLAEGGIEITGGEVLKLDQNRGKYIATVRSGLLYEITANADGYEEGQPVEIKDVNPNDFIKRIIYLKRKSNKGLLMVRTQPEGIPIVDNVNANNQYPIALELGTETEVTLTAPKFWPLSRQGFTFVGWRVGDSAELSDAITQTFQLDSNQTLIAEYELADGMIFYPGWNLVSSPLVFDDSSADNIFVKSNGTPFYHHGSVWKWQNNTFKTDSELKTGNGYWINSLETAFIPVNGNSPDSNGISCNKGWNLVGVKGLQPLSAPGNFEFSGNIWLWDNEHQRFLPISSDELPANQRNKLIPGHGYWMYCRE